MTPTVTIIVAIDRSGAIGRRGDLIYRLPADLRRFKATTMGHPVIMGRRTWESLPKALPGRRNIVVTRNPSYSAPGAETAPTLAAAIALASQETAPITGDLSPQAETSQQTTPLTGDQSPQAETSQQGAEVFIIGGAQLYAAALPLAHRLIITQIDAECPDADTYFPPIPADFITTSREPLDTTPPAAILTLTRP